MIWNALSGELKGPIARILLEGEGEGGSGTDGAGDDINDKNDKSPAGDDINDKNDKSPADDGKTPADGDDKPTPPRSIATGGDLDDESDADDAAEPVTYEEFNVPEGMQLDGPLLEKATPMFSGLGLDQEKAQQVVSFYAELKQAEDVANAESFKEQQDEYRKAVKDDPDFGGDNYDNTQRMCAFVVKKFGGDGLASLLDSTGFGNHPDVVRALARIGAQFHEKGVVLGDSKDTKEDIPAEKRWYPKMKEQIEQGQVEA